MSTDGRRARPVGNPVRVAGLRRILRSNPVAAALAVWTIAIFALVVAVLVHHTGADRPFHASAANPKVVGRSVAQWWIVAQVVGICLLVPVVAALSLAGTTEQAMVQTWRSSLVTDRQVARGMYLTQLAFVVLAVLVVLPVGGLALALGGPSVVQLGVGELGVLATGAVVAAVSCAICGTARRVSSALVLTLLVVVVVIGGTAVWHGFRGGTSGRSDPVLMANPLVATADAAAPRAVSPTGVTAAQAPLVHLRETVQPSEGGLPPWSRTAIGGAALIMVSLGITMVRLRRIPRRSAP